MINSGTSRVRTALPWHAVSRLSAQGIVANYKFHGAYESLIGFVDREMPATNEPAHKPHAAQYPTLSRGPQQLSLPHKSPSKPPLALLQSQSPIPENLLSILDPRFPDLGAGGSKQLVADKYIYIRRRAHRTEISHHPAPHARHCEPVSPRERVPFCRTT